MSRTGKSIGFTLIFVAVNLHLLRNVLGPIYLAAYGAAFLWALLALTARKSDKRPNLTNPGIVFVWCVIMPTLGLLTSIGFISLPGAVTGLIRYIFAMPVFMALIAYTDDIVDLKRHVSVATGFFAVACATIPFQVVTGQSIQWFAAASERGGYERYASLAGSLTTVGIAVGCYIVLAAVTRPIIHFSTVIVMAISAAMSLSKSGMANVAIGLAATALIGRRNLGRIAMMGLITLGALGLAWAYSPSVRDRAASTLESFGIQTGVTTGPNYDYTVEESIVARLTTLPLENFQALETLHSPLVYLTGGGFGMASTALVPAADSLAGMAHNQFAEMYTVFGPLGLIVTVLLFATVARELRKRTKSEKSPIYPSALAALGVFAVNSVFANGTFYQPASASILYFILFIALSSRVLINEPQEIQEASVHQPAERSHLRSASAGTLMTPSEIRLISRNHVQRGTQGRTS